MFTLDIYFFRKKLVLINLYPVFPEKNCCNFSYKHFFIKCENYACIQAIIIVIFHFNNPFSSKPTVVSVKISESSDLRSPYHRLGNRKNLTLLLEKFFKTLKQMIITFWFSYNFPKWGK